MKTVKAYYMEDCVHLKACRRLQLIAKKNGHLFPRGCDSDCTAYLGGEAVKEKVADTIRHAIHLAQEEGVDFISWRNPETFIEWLQGGEP